MIRKFVLPALAVALLAGCVTGDYARPGGGRGDYYYGNPTTEYRQYGPYGGYGPYGPSGYGYGGFGYGGFGYGNFGYGVPRGYYGGPYRHRGNYIPPHPHYRPYYPRPPVTQHPHPDGDNAPPPQHRRDDGRPPWRNLDGLQRRQSADGGGGAPREVVPDRPAAEPRERGSRAEQTMRRAERSAEGRVLEQDQ